MLERVASTLSLCGASAASLMKCAVRSRKPSPIKETPKRRVIIMGNGPSLRQTIDYDRSALRNSDLMAVNFFPNSSEFFDLKPTMLILADPHFFTGMEKDPNVARLWRRLQMVDWPLTLFIPTSQKRFSGDMINPDSPIKLSFFNLTPVEGDTRISHLLFDLGLGMPRPRNVLIPAIMMALRAGYRDIWLVGADHSWSKSLWVDDANRVISVQPHFYKDNEKERNRVAKEYEGYHLHQIFNSLSVAFRSYHQIAAYANRLGATITNATPGSFIDAFDRKPLS